MIRYLVNAWRNLTRRHRLEEELDDELSATLALLIEEKRHAGLSQDAARRAARLELGSPQALKDDIRDARAGVLLDTLLRDLRYGVRLLNRAPTFSVIAILTVALGTGANAAVFQLVNAVALRPLPVDRPDELVSIGIDRHGKPQRGRREAGRSVFTEPLWRELRSQQQAFASLFAWGSGRWDLSTEGEVVWADGFYVSGSFFTALGIRPHLGRLLTDADDRPGCSPVAVLSHDFWQRRYGSNPGVIGQRITLDRQWFDIAGVAPSGFLGVESGRTFDVVIPLCAEPLVRAREAGTGRPDVWWLDIMARVKPGSSLGRARAQIAVISRDVFHATVSPGYAPMWAKEYEAFTLTAQPAPTGVSMLPPVAFAVLWILLGVTGLVLVLTCANLANLMLARAAARDRELALRLAIGATRTRLLAQLVAESALIAIAGSVSGFVLSRWLSRLLVLSLNSGSLPVRIAMDLTVDWRVFTLTASAAAVVCVLCGLGPALKTTRQHPVSAMQPAGRSSTEGYEAVRLRRALVVVQVAVSMVLVVGALLFVRTLRTLADIDLGFDPAVVVASVDLRRTPVAPDARLNAFARIVDRLEAVPGVRHAAEAMIVPLSGADWNGQVVRDGEVQAGEVHFNAVGPDYFRAMGTALRQGRSFERSDRPGSPRVAIVSDTFARRYFPHVNAIGQAFQVDGGHSYTVIGVVKDTKWLAVGTEPSADPAPNATRASSLPLVYLAAAQEMIPTPATLRIVIRTRSPAAWLTPTITRAITDAVPGAAVSYEEISRYVDTLLLPQRLVGSIAGFFGVLAMLIASIGVYGIMSYVVTRRRVEIGVRLALGAQPRTVVRMILRESATVLAIGIVLGVLLAGVALRPAAGLLYELRPSDPVSFGIGSGLLAVVGLLAVWIPARRASAVAPVVALRE